MRFLTNVVVVFVVMIIALIIIPLPPFFLDFMFIMSISISLMILTTTMFINGPLEFSVFPSLLLITTLLRLALNISSTPADPFKQRAGGSGHRDLRKLCAGRQRHCRFYRIHHHRSGPVQSSLPRARRGSPRYPPGSHWMRCPESRWPSTRT